MFDLYNFPIELEKEGIRILCKEEQERVVIYRRIIGDEEVKKVLLVKDGQISINPIEPLNTPKRITPYILIEFENPLMIEPKVSKSIFITFPIEIGVFVTGNKYHEILDIFSLVKKKFTLYGSPRGGYVCKWWKTKVFSSMPSVNLINEGILDLKIMNETQNWVQLTRGVFNAYGMKIYFNNDIVSAKATMSISPHEIAETDFVNAPLIKNMKKALEVYTVSKLSITSAKFTMSEGL